MKRFWRLIWTFCQWTTLSGGCLAILAADLWARGEVEKPADNKSSGFVLPYILVILGIALGMLVVCKSSGRRDRAKPEAYSEGKESGEEEEKKDDKKKK
jgi:hypothetical protein